MNIKVTVYGTEFAVEVDDDGTMLAAHTTGDVLDLLSARTDSALSASVMAEFDKQQREKAIEAIAEMLADARTQE